MIRLAVILALAATPVAAQVKSVPKACKPFADRAAGKGPVAPMKLGEMPPANHLKAVWRTDARGCPDPIVLNRAIGANPERAVPVDGDPRVQPAR